MPHKGHDNKPTRKPQRIFRDQDGTTVRLTVISRCGASKCHMLRHCGRPKTTIAALFLFLFPFPFPVSPIPLPLSRSQLLCSCHCHSYLLALAIPCCFSIIYVIDISTRSFRTVFRRQRLPPPPSHTLQFIVAINWAPALTGSQSILFTAFVLRNHCLVPSCVHHRFRDEMRWSSAANLMH